MRRHLLTLLAGLALLTAPIAAPTAHAADPPAESADGPCANPRSVVYNLLYWLQAERYEPEKAGQCQDRSQLEDPAVTGPALAEQLKAVLDARGLYININLIPADAAYTNPFKQPIYEFLPGGLGGIEIVQKDGQWLFSAGSLQRIPELHEATFSASIISLIESLPEWSRAPLPIVSLAAWQLIGLFLLVILAWTARRILVAILRFIVRRASGLSKARWLVSLLDRSDGPLGLLMFALLLTLGQPLLQLPLTFATGLRVIPRLLGAIATVWIAFRATDLLCEFLGEKAAQSETKLDDQVVPILRKILKVIVGIMGMIFILDNLNVDVTTLVASISIGGVAIAFAAKDTLSNFFGSAMVFLDQPFQIGDYVTIAGSTSGTVEEVGFRSSRLRTPVGSLVTLPNARMTDSQIENLGARPNRRYDITLGLTYGTSAEAIQAFCEGCVQVIEAHPMTVKDQNLVRFIGFGPSSLDVMVRCWFDTQDFGEEQDCKHSLNMELLRLAEALGVGFAFPSQSLYVEQMPADVAPAGSGRDLQAVARGFGPGGAQSHPQRWDMAPKDEG